MADLTPTVSREGTDSLWDFRTTSLLWSFGVAVVVALLLTQTGTVALFSSSVALDDISMRMRTPGRQSNIHQTLLVSGLQNIPASLHRLFYVGLIAICSGMAHRIIINASRGDVSGRIIAISGGVLVGFRSEDWFVPYFINGAYPWFGVFGIFATTLAITSYSRFHYSAKLLSPSARVSRIQRTGSVSLLGVGLLALVFLAGSAANMALMSFLLALVVIQISRRRRILSNGLNISVLAGGMVVTLFLALGGVSSHPYAGMPGRIDISLQSPFRGLTLLAHSISPAHEGRLTTGTEFPSASPWAVVLLLFSLVPLLYLLRRVRAVPTPGARGVFTGILALYFAGAGVALGSGILTRLHVWYFILPGALWLVGVAAASVHLPRLPRAGAAAFLSIVLLLHVIARVQHLGQLDVAAKQLEAIESAIGDVLANDDADYVVLVVPHVPLNSGLNAEARVASLVAWKAAVAELNRRPRIMVHRCGVDVAIPEDTLDAANSRILLTTDFLSWRAVNWPCEG